jgi:hypothetical protein
MLEHGGLPVGVILTIAQTITHAGPAFVRCNLASWYVDPAFRSHAALLSTMPLRNKTATFLNISAAPNTWPIIEAQGYLRYTRGQFVALPALSGGEAGVRIERFRPDDPMHGARELPEARLLADHAASGCVCLVGVAPDGRHPFVFLPFRPKQGLLWFPGMQLVYSRSAADVARFAAPIGRALARIGKPLLLIDADGPVEGLRGYFWRDRGRRFFKGRQRPWLGDLAYTEFTLFGP